MMRRQQHIEGVVVQDGTNLRAAFWVWPRNAGSRLVRRRAAVGHGEDELQRAVTSVHAMDVGRSTAVLSCKGVI